MAGAKSVQINSRGYRTTENVWSPAEAGENVSLTIDVKIQQAAEAALKNARVAYLPPVRGAVVVMDVNTGDILAMASSPTLDPNVFVKGGVSAEEWKKIYEFQAEKNRATQEHYAPGSVFKTIVGLAALEAGLNKAEIVRVPPEKCIYVHGHPFRDTAEPGEYDFNRALSRSSNTYFVTMGLRFGPERIVRVAQHLHLGERTGLGTRQEATGTCPALQRVQSRAEWNDISTGNMSIGQDPILMTPLQVAVLTSALANGGKVIFPRVVDRVEPMDPASEKQPITSNRGRVRDELGVSQTSMTRLHEAMLHETEDPDGTGSDVRRYVPSLRVCGKTGTAQVQNVHGTKIGQITWFASFAPYGSPRYAVVVMVEDGESGTKSCVPAAGKVYQAILEREASRTSLTSLTGPPGRTTR
jgi:penicillin-binding protein 2